MLPLLCRLLPIKMVQEVSIFGVPGLVKRYGYLIAIYVNSKSEVNARASS